jgi:hypothetical protein
MIIRDLFSDGVYKKTVFLCKPNLRFITPADTSGRLGKMSHLPNRIQKMLGCDA